MYFFQALAFFPFMLLLSNGYAADVCDNSAWRVLEREDTAQQVKASLGAVSVQLVEESLREDDFGWVSGRQISSAAQAQYRVTPSSGQPYICNVHVQVGEVSYRRSAENTNMDVEANITSRCDGFPVRVSFLGIPTL